MSDPKSLAELLETVIFDFEITLDDLIDYLPEAESKLFETMPFAQQKSFLLRYRHGMAKGLESGLLRSFAEVAEKIMAQLAMEKFLSGRSVIFVEEGNQREANISAVNDNGTVTLQFIANGEELDQVPMENILFTD